MSLRSTVTTVGETPTYRQPTIRSKVWGFEPFWKFVNYDVELSSNSSNSSAGKMSFDDDFYFVAGISPTDKPDLIGSFSTKKFDSSKGVERIIPIQRVRTTSMTIPPAKTATLTKTPTLPATLTKTPTLPVKEVKLVDNRNADKSFQDRQQKLLADISNFNKSSTERSKTTDDLPTVQKKVSTKIEKPVDDLSTIQKKSSTKDERVSTLTRRSPPRDDKKVDEFHRKTSTMEKRPKQAPASSRYQSHTLPIKIPSAAVASAKFYLEPKFDSLPSHLEVQGPIL
jgi:hypothetical protein